MGVEAIWRLGAADIRAWRGRHWLTQADAALWFDRSCDWVKSVECGRRCVAFEGLHPHILGVFRRFYAIEAYAKAIQAEVMPDATGPKASVALQRAIEALRAAGMQASDVERLMPQLFETKAQSKEKGKTKA